MREGGREEREGGREGGRGVGKGRESVQCALGPTHCLPLPPPAAVCPRG